jgi:4-alpha-glucanotransferase
VSYRADELHALVALEASRAGAQVVGEDLGTLTEEVRDRMRRDQMLRSWVFKFESTPDEPLPGPGPATLASLGTHDLPRFGAYLWGEDLRERAVEGHLTAREEATEHATRTKWRQGLFEILGIAPDEDPEQLTRTAHAACLHHLARSEARVVLVDLEELWDERRAQNHPGTTAKTNWSHRARRTFEDFSTDEHLTATLTTISTERSA